MDLQREIESLFHSIFIFSESLPEEDKQLVRHEINSLKERLNQPLRIAIIGQIKRGKSTLMNALLRDKLLITGVEETTYTVSWFKYGEIPALEVVFDDEKRKTVELNRDNLTFWTARESSTPNPELDRVEYVIIYYPNPVFKKLEFIDTPGFNSTYLTDAERAKKFLALRETATRNKSADEVEEEVRLKADENSRKFLSMADAYMYLADPRGFQAIDYDILQDINRDGMMTPIKTLGILSRVDKVWTSDNAQDVPSHLLKELIKTAQNRLQRVIYQIYPVCAKMVENIPEEEMENCMDLLMRLSDVDEKILLNYYLTDPDSFKESEIKDLPIDFADRKLLYDCFGLYGVYELLQLFAERRHAGAEVTPDDVKHLLLEKSGINALEKVIYHHFGQRQYLIQADVVLAGLARIFRDIKRRNGMKTSIVMGCNYILEDIRKIQRDRIEFGDFEALQSYYNGNFTLSRENREEFLQVLGEEGTSYPSRLGFKSRPDEALLKNLLEEARRRKITWYRIANGFGCSYALERAATTVARSCERMTLSLSEMLDEDAISGSVNGDDGILTVVRCEEIR